MPPPSPEAGLTILQQTEACEAALIQLRQERQSRQQQLQQLVHVQQVTAVGTYLSTKLWSYKAEAVTFMLCINCLIAEDVTYY